jgi:hypothetical protein
MAEEFILNSKIFQMPAPERQMPIKRHCNVQWCHRAKTTFLIIRFGNSTVEWKHENIYFVKFSLCYLVQMNCAASCISDFENLTAILAINRLA